MTEIRNMGLQFDEGAIQAGHKVEIVRLADPYSPGRQCKFRPLPGNKYVLIDVAVTNTDVMPVVASFSDFSLETDRGRKYNPICMPDLDDDYGAARCPGPGQTENGSLLFEIPLIATPLSLWEEIAGEANLLQMPDLGTEAVA